MNNLPQRQRKMYVIYTKLNTKGTFVLCDEKGAAIISPLYTELQNEAYRQAMTERFIIETLIYAEFLMEEL